MSERNSLDPIAVIQTKHTYSDQEMEQAMAALRAIIPRDLIALLSYHLVGMARERANGQLMVAFNLNGGRALSADFERRTHWAPSKDPSSQ